MFFLERVTSHKNAPRRVSVWAWPLLVTYTIRPHGDVKLTPRCQSCVNAEPPCSALLRLVAVYAARSYLRARSRSLVFDRLPFRFGFAGDLSVDLIAKGHPCTNLWSIRVGRTIGFEFGFAKSGTWAIPANLGTFLLDVIHSLQRLVLRAVQPNPKPSSGIRSPWSC